MRIALVAEEAAGLRALHLIAAAGHELPMVFCSAAGGQGSPHPVAIAAEAAGAEVWRADRVRDPRLGRELRAHSIDVLLNVHSLHVIHDEVLAGPRVGAFNLHPGPLPEYAGLNTVSWAIYEGATEYGATLHWMVPRIDAGPIAYETRFAIDPHASAARLTAHCVREGLALVGLLLAALAEGHAPPSTPQDMSRRRYFGRGVPREGLIDWRAQSARSIVALVRACDYGPFPSPWGRPRARIGDMNVEITRAILTATPTDVAPGTIGGASLSGGLLVAASDEWVDVQTAVVEGRQVPGNRLGTAGRPF